MGPMSEVGNTVEFEPLFVSPTPSEGWDRVGTTEEVGTGRNRCQERRDARRSGDENEEWDSEARRVFFVLIRQPGGGRAGRIS